MQCIFLLWNLILQVFLPTHQGALQGPVITADENWWMVGGRSKSTLGLINMHWDARAGGKYVFSFQVNCNLVLPPFVFTKYKWRQIFSLFVWACESRSTTNRIQIPHSGEVGSVGTGGWEEQVTIGCKWLLIADLYVSSVTAGERVCPFNGKRLQRVDILFLFYFFSLTTVIYLRSFLVRFFFFLWRCISLYFLKNNHKVCLMATKSLLFSCIRTS